MMYSVAMKVFAMILCAVYGFPLVFVVFFYLHSTSEGNYLNIYQIDTGRQNRKIQLIHSLSLSYSALASVRRDFSESWKMTQYSRVEQVVELFIYFWIVFTVVVVFLHHHITLFFIILTKPQLYHHHPPNIILILFYKSQFTQINFNIIYF